jgi:hypothetical protein
MKPVDGDIGPQYIRVWPVGTSPTGDVIEAVNLDRATQWVYEAARIEAIASYRPIVPEPWGQRDQDFREQMVRYMGWLAKQWTGSGKLPTPEEAHNSWVREYEKMGWRYGPVFDPAAKTDPNMVVFDWLPEAERDKVALFLDLVAFALRWICRLPPAALWCGSHRPGLPKPGPGEGPDPADARKAGLGCRMDFDEPWWRHAYRCGTCEAWFHQGCLVLHLQRRPECDLGR